MQNQSTSPSRNSARAASIPGKVSTPTGPGPSTPSSPNGHSPGSAVKGFGGGLIPGKC